MKNQPHLSRRTVPVIAFLLGCMSLSGIILVDVIYLHTGLFQEGSPKLGFGWLLRSAAIFLSLVVIAFSVAGERRPRVVLSTKSGPSLERFSVLGTVFISSLFLLVFLVQPAVFSAMSQENYPIEIASAFLLFCACATSISQWPRPHVQELFPITLFHGCRQHRQYCRIYVRHGGSEWRVSGVASKPIRSRNDLWCNQPPRHAAAGKRARLASTARLAQALRGTA